MDLDETLTEASDGCSLQSDTLSTHPKLLKSYKSDILRWILMKLSQKLQMDVLSNLTPSPGSSKIFMFLKTPGKDIDYMSFPCSSRKSISS